MGMLQWSVRVEATVPMVFSADETCDVGNEFSGRVDWVQIDLGEDADHLISPQERLRVAMARQ